MNSRISRAVALVFALVLVLAAVMQASASDIADTGARADVPQFHKLDGDGGTLAPDALAALRERVAPNTVFPPDERERVSPARKTVAFLIGVDAQINPTHTCSGTFIGPKVVLTAAHCLYNPEFGGWAYNVAIFPGADGENSLPYGPEVGAYAEVPGGWAQTFSPEWDWGIVVLESADLGNTVGWETLGVDTTATLAAADFSPVTYGYPGDQELATQWQTVQPSFAAVDDRLLFNMLDAYPGQSGSPVFHGQQGELVGILDAEMAEANIAVRVTQVMLDDLLAACDEFGCEFAYTIEGSEPDPTPPTETPTPTPPTGTDAGAAFDKVWSTTDAAVAQGQAAYSWFWGPQSNVDTAERYDNSPAAQREVRYYDKSRMEITHPEGDPNSIWYVTNGLLTVELITGNMQVSDSDFEQHAPSTQLVAGDPGNNPGTPSYATFAPFVTTDGTTNRAADRTGQEVHELLTGAGQLTADQPNQGVTLASYQDVTGHNIANVFWTWMNDPANGFRPDEQVDWLYVLGYPISEPYWIDATVGGTTRRVLVQLFQRRILTYTPGNPAAYQVEFGNIGRHYYDWRYEQ